MAGLVGNQAWWALSRQTAKGTASATASYKYPFADGNFSPNRETDSLSETDSSRDPGTTYVKSSGVQGDPSMYARLASIGLPLLTSFGTLVTTGTTDYTHTFTLGTTLNYVTAWRMLGGLLWERYEDCMVDEFSISAGAGEPLMASLSLMGRRATRLTSDPASGVNLDNANPFNFNEAAITLSSGATSLISNFEMTLSNGVSLQQTDDVVPYDVVAGTRELSVGFDLIFENLDEYNKFHYGTTAGTVISNAIYTTDASFTFTKTATQELSFTFPRISLEEFPVAPDAGGDPITVSVRGVGQRGGTSMVTAVLKNQVASYPAS